MKCTWGALGVHLGYTWNALGGTWDTLGGGALRKPRKLSPANPARSFHRKLSLELLAKSSSPKNHSPQAHPLNGPKYPRNASRNATRKTDGEMRPGMRPGMRPKKRTPKRTAKQTKKCACYLSISLDQDFFWANTPQAIFKFNYFCYY